MACGRCAREVRHQPAPRQRRRRCSTRFPLRQGNSEATAWKSEENWVNNHTKRSSPRQLDSWEATASTSTTVHKEHLWGFKQSTELLCSTSTSMQRAQTEAQEVPSEHEEELLPSEGDGALAQAAQGGCGVSFSTHPSDIYKHLLGPLTAFSEIQMMNSVVLIFRGELEIAKGIVSVMELKSGVDP